MTYTTVNISLTTVQGILSGALAFATALLPYWPRYATPALLIIGAAKAAVGVMQKDAGSEKAKLPGVDGVVNVPSHETPDVAGAKVVK